MSITDKFPGPWKVAKLLDGYKVVSADGRCLAMFAPSRSESALSCEDAQLLATAFAELGAPQLHSTHPQEAEHELPVVRPPRKHKALP